VAAADRRITTKLDRSPSQSGRAVPRVVERPPQRLVGTLRDREVKGIEPFTQAQSQQLKG
jgi:hypothetical protein